MGTSTKFGAIMASVEMYNAAQIDAKFARYVNGMVYQGSKPNFSAIQQVANPKVGDFYNALDTDINYCYHETVTYTATSDTEIVDGKTYYTESGDVITEPSADEVSTYFEKVVTGSWDKVGGVFQLPDYLTEAELEAKYVAIESITTYLTGYATQAWVNQQSFVTSGSLATTLSGYITTQSLANTLSGYVATTALNTALSEYTKTNELNELIGGYGYLKESDVTNLINTAISGFKTESQIKSLITAYGYQTASQVNSAISSALTTYKDNTALETWIAGKGYATTSQLPSEQSANVQAINQKLTAASGITMPNKDDVTVEELWDTINTLRAALGASS